MSVVGKVFSHKKHFAFFLFAAFVMFFIAAQETSPDSPPFTKTFLPVSGIPHLFSGRFSNGLDVYFLKDYSAPSASFCYAVKAGTSIQTPETTGFAELYARLFFSPAGGQQSFYDNGAFSVNTECTSDYALYSATFSADRIADIFSLLAECVGAGSFPEEELAAQYQVMRRKADEWDASPESYINGAMDAKMFPAYPWSRETGLYPKGFEATGIDGATTILDDMRRTFYVPENSAFFVCGPFAPEEVFSLILNCVPDTDSAPVENNALAAGDESKLLFSEELTCRFSGRGGRYVLVSDSFSKEFNQIIVQYVLPDFFMTAAGAAATETAAAETAAAIFQNGSAFKNLILADENCGIKSADWLYTSFSRQQSGSRLIFQALMENGEVSPGTQALAFSRHIESPDVFPADEAAYFSHITADRLSLLRRDPFQFIHALAEDWAFCNPVFPAFNDFISRKILPEFYPDIEPSDFSGVSFSRAYVEAFSAAYKEAALALTSDELFHILDSEPYIFLLLNNEVYKANKESLEKDGFTLISQDEGEWYKIDDYKAAGAIAVPENSDTQPASSWENASPSFAEIVAEKCVSLLAQNSESTPSPGTDEPIAVSGTPHLADGIGNFIAHGKAATEQYELSNGIPVLAKDGTSSSFSFQIQFSGKNEGYSASQRDSRAVISDVITNNIKQYLLLSGIPYTVFSVSAENSLYGTSITINTMSEYAEPVISLAAEALFFGEISAPRVDECAYSRGSEWSMKRADGDFQLYCAALARLYQGTAGAGYYDLSEDFFAGISFQDIEMEYLDMLDASCISLALCGENAADYVPIAENLFGFLMSFSSSCRDADVSAPAQAFPDDSVSVTCRRIFTSSVKPGEYVVQPSKLIPTEVFYDPLHIYFECPAYDSPEYSVFVALVYELADILDGMWDGGVLSSLDKLYTPIAGIWFHDVTKAAEVYNVFEEGIARLNEPFDEARLKKIRDRYVEKFCSAQDSSSFATGLMLESRFYSDKTARSETTNSGVAVESRFYGGDVANNGITTYLSQLEQLKNATTEDFARIAARFSTMPTLRALSADTK